MENVWNKLVSIRNSSKNQLVVDQAGRLLTQMNTAGGQTMLSEEAKFFIIRNCSNQDNVVEIVAEA